jgi:hypothetical protein
VDAAVVVVDVGELVVAAVVVDMGLVVTVVAEAAVAVMPR